MKNWSDYPIFLTVVEKGSLTAAGQALGLSQPTVGRRIRALEEAFGVRLLKKHEGQLLPTAFGQSILEHIRRMHEEACAIDRSSAQLEDSLSGVVRLSATEGIGTVWLPPVMMAFRQKHPDIMIDMGIGFRNFNLAQREADIALRWESPGEQNSLITRKVASISFGLFAAKSYIRRRGVPQSLEELKDHDAVVTMIKDDYPLWVQDDNKKPMFMPDRVTFRTNSVWAFDVAIQSGYGIGALPLFACMHGEGDAIIDSHLVERVLPNLSQQVDLWIVAHEDLRRSVRIRAVYDYIIDAFRQDAAFFLNGGRSIFSEAVL